MSVSQKYNTIIFDNDGVLIEPTDINKLKYCIKKSFREFGINNPKEKHLESMIRPDKNSVIKICRKYNINPSEFWKIREKEVTKIQKKEIQNGSKGLYEDVYKQISSLDDVKLALVSNNQQNTVEYIINFFDIDSFFDTIYGREPTIKGIKRKKPNPYYLKKALRDLNSKDGIYVGDSNTDIKAAKNIGIDSVFIRRKHRKNYSLKYNATYEIDTLSKLSQIL